MAGNPNKPISEAQINFIVKLVGERDISGLPQGQREFLADLSEENLGRMNGLQAGNAITGLLGCPKKPLEDRLAASQTKVREGYFFIVDPTNDEERFFRVRHGKEETRWEGYVFLDV